MPLKKHEGEEKDLSEDVVSDAVVESEGDSVIDIDFLSTGSDVDPVPVRRRRRPHRFSKRSVSPSSSSYS